MTGRPETQADRCSAQHHLWRFSRPGYPGVMSCRCGAVHPDDLDAFLAALGAT